MKRVYAYRQQLGTERERPDRRLTVLILVATGLAGLRLLAGILSLYLNVRFPPKVAATAFDPLQT